MFYCFPLFLCTDHWGRLSYLSLVFFATVHSNGYIFAFILCLSLFFFSQLFVRLPQTTFLNFFFLRMVLITASCTMSQTSVHNSSGTLSDLISWISLWLPLYNHNGFLFFCFFVFFLMALPCGLWDISSGPGIEPGFWQWKRWALSTGQPGNSWNLVIN